MTEKSWPWTGDVSLGAVGDAGPYANTVWTTAWLSLAANRWDADAGIVQGTPGSTGSNSLLVEADSPASASVFVERGLALVNGYMYQNITTTVEVAISANASGNPRIDLIVLQLLVTGVQEVRIATLEGTPAGTPVPPGVTHTPTTYEIPLAEIAVANGFSTITSSDITDRRHSSGAFGIVGNPVDVNIFAGSFVRTGAFQVVSAQTGTTDDLDTITGLFAGYVVTLKAADTHTITLIHGTGADEFNFAHGADVDLSGSEIMQFVHDGTNLIEVNEYLGRYTFNDDMIGAALNQEINQRKAIQISRSTSQAVSTTPATLVTNTIDYNDGGFFSVTGGIITLPAADADGQYSLWVKMSMTTQTGITKIRIVVNGGLYAEHWHSNDSASAETEFAFGMELELGNDDTVAIQYSNPQNTGSGPDAGAFWGLRLEAKV